jgi:hypothetical protein
LSADWTRRKLSWLEAVACDRRTRGLPLAVAVVIAVRYLNSESENAWPAVATLAKAVDTDRRSVQRALRGLIDRGWLSCARRDRRTNVYRITLRSDAIKGPDAAFGGRSTRRSKSGLDTSLGGGLDAALTRELNPRRNPREGASAPAPPNRPDCFPGRAQRGRRRSIPLPDDWKLGAPEKEAALSVTDWDPERAQNEFDRFLDWHRARQPFSYDWVAAWTNWCRRDSDSGGRRSAPLTGVRSAVLELRDWLDEKKRTD